MTKMPKCGDRDHRFRQLALGDDRDRRTSCATSTNLRPTICASGRFRFLREIADFVREHKRVYVVEQNRDAQMLSLLKLDLRTGAGAEAAQHCAPRRPAARRALRHRRNCCHGGKVMATTPGTTHSPLRKPIAWDLPCSIIAAARPRCARAAATMRFPSASLTQFTKWACSPSAWPK